MQNNVLRAATVSHDLGLSKLHINSCNHLEESQLGVNHLAHKKDPGKYGQIGAWVHMSLFGPCKIRS